MRTYMKLRPYLSINTIERGIRHELIDFWNPDVVVLVDDTLGFYLERLQSGIRPPRDSIAVLVILSTLIIETMCDFVANHLP